MTPHEANAEQDQHLAHKIWSRLYGVWERTHVSHRGAYTTRRVRALEHYCHSVSLPRVLAVCFLTPLPILSFVLAMELLPLNPPSDGWRTNSAWIVRYVFVFNLVSLSCLQQVSSFLTTLNVTLGQGLAIAWITVSCYFIVLLTIMAFWVFPIPFVFQLTGGVFGAVFIGCIVIILGRQTLAKTPKFTAQFRVLYYVSVVEGAMCIVYPVFSAVFHVLNGIQQLAVILVLYVLKVFTRLSMANACCSSLDAEDRLQSLARLPERVVFTANLFHLVYLMTCLQGSRISIWTIGTLISIDTFTSAFSVKRLLRRPVMVLVCSPPKDSSKPIIRSSASVMPLNGPPAPALSSKLPIASRVARSFMTREVRIKLVRRSLSRLSGRSTSRQSSCRSRIIPSQRTEISERRRPDPTSKPKPNDNIVQFQTLSMAEYSILVKYVSCMIPVMVGIYTTVLATLPNAVYYPALANAKSCELKASQRDVAIYAMLQMFSLIIFEQILRRRLHYSVFHQLGFVLETAAADIQAKLGMFIPYCFFFFLEHNGESAIQSSRRKVSLTYMFSGVACAVKVWILVSSLLGYGNKFTNRFPLNNPPAGNKCKRETYGAIDSIKFRSV